MALLSGQRFLAALIQSGLTVSVYILLRESVGLWWMNLWDAPVCVIAAMATLGLSYWHSRDDGRPVHSAIIGVAATAVTSVLMTGLGVVALTLAGWAETSWFFGPLILLMYLFISTVSLALAAMAGGLGSGALFTWVQRPLGRSGHVLGAAFALIAMIVPIGATVSRETIGRGFIAGVGFITGVKELTNLSRDGNRRFR